MRLLTILGILVVGAAPLLAEKPPSVRIITAEERKSCTYLGLVSIGSMWAWHSPKGALNGALKKVAKLGGDSLFVIGQNSDFMNGAAMSGEAYRCATKSQ